MDRRETLELLDRGDPIVAGSPFYNHMCEACQRAMQITAELNTGYHSPEEVRELFSKLTCRPVDESFRLFPPLYTEYGQNIKVGRNVFINACCCFQDQGGVTIGDGSFIGHRVVFATLNHDLCPSKRSTLHPKPITLGANVWVGASATILPGVTIGDGAVVAAGAVVTRDVAPNTVVAGVPARKVREVTDE